MKNYDDQFFQRHRDGARRSARAVVPLVLKLVPARSVIDLGCGEAVWLSVFAEHGLADIQGVDGDYVERDRLMIPAGQYHPHDLTRPLKLKRTFDLAVSLEVAEHLPPESGEMLVASLTQLAPVVLFSAAIPYQGGEHHINEQWPAYWAERFAAHDYLPIDCLRRRLWDHRDVDWWYAQNALLYVRRSRLEADDVLSKEHEAAGPTALSLVHPRRFLEWIEWGLGLCGAEPSPAARVGVME